MHNFKMAICAAVAILTTFSPNLFAQVEPNFSSFNNVTFRYESVTGIGPQAGLLRRDPSDIIKVDDTYYVWYTKVLQNTPGYPEGYAGNLWYASSSNGVNWTEQGQALATGQAGKFDDFGVFTPNIFYAPTTNKYYVYYTGVQNNSASGWQLVDNPGAIGAAVSEGLNPDGTFKPFTRVNSGDPVLSARTASSSNVFDGWHVDDTVMMFRDNQYQLYYKGHSLPSQLNGTGLPNGSTPMGLAVSDRPDGGFVRVPVGAKEFLVQPGHELLLWEYGTQVASLTTGHFRPPHPDDFHVLVSPDGLNFTAVGPTLNSVRQNGSNGVRAPGAYRPEITDPLAHGSGLRWGLGMTGYGGGSGLQRFNVNLGLSPIGTKMWSIDFQGDGVNGVFGQQAPVDYAEPFNQWNIFEVPSVSGSPSANINQPEMILQNHEGVVENVRFNILTDNIFGWSGFGDAQNAIDGDYLVLADQFGGSHTLDWEITGLNPNAQYQLALYHADVAGDRGLEFLVDANGDGALGDETTVAISVGGETLLVIQTDANGGILGRSSATGSEGDWSGLQLRALPLPEPASLSILGISSLFAIRRQR